MTSIFNTNNIAQNINSLSSPDPIFGIYILSEWNHWWATVYVNYVQRLHSGPLFMRHSVVMLILVIANWYSELYKGLKRINAILTDLLINSIGVSHLYKNKQSTKSTVSQKPNQYD